MSKNFKKYKSIENSYRQKHILKALEWYPELKDITYSIREKIDGSNFQIYFDKDGNILYGKRSSFLGADEPFFDYQNVVAKYEDEIKVLADHVRMAGVTLRVFGEIYGQGVQKRVNYGEGKHLCFFDMEIEDEMVSQKRFEEIMRDLSLEHMHCPLIGYADNLEEALNVSVDFDSKIMNVENNPSEGVVIKPYAQEFDMANGQRFILKKKSDKFSEKMKVKPGSVKQEEAAKVVKAKAEFASYFTENRLLGIFSKHGEIQDMKEFGKYIQLFIADAKGDFLKEFELEGYTEKEIRAVFNSGGKYAATLIKKFV